MHAAYDVLVVFKLLIRQRECLITTSVPNSIGEEDGLLHWYAGKLDH